MSWIESAALEPAADFKQPELSKLIRELRQVTGRTPEQFAAVLSVSVSLLNRWKNGQMQLSPVLAQVSHSSASELQDGNIAELFLNTSCAIADKPNSISALTQF